MQSHLFAVAYLKSIQLKINVLVSQMDVSWDMNRGWFLEEKRGRGVCRTLISTIAKLMIGIKYVVKGIMVPSEVIYCGDQGSSFFLTLACLMETVVCNVSM